METEQKDPLTVGQAGVHDDAFRFNLSLECQNTLCGRHTRGAAAQGGLLMGPFSSSVCLFIIFCPITAKKRCWLVVPVSQSQPV